MRTEITDIQKWLIEYYSYDDYELRELFVHCDEALLFRNVVESIKSGYITSQQFIDGEYHHCGDRYYSYDDYECINGTIYDSDECFCCELSGEMHHQDDQVRLFTGRNDEQFVSRQAVENDSDYMYFDGDWYDDRAMECRDIVYIQDECEYGYACDNYYHEEGGYYSYPEDREEYTRGYHDGNYRSLDFDGKSKYKIGFEIEKEDSSVKESIDIDDFEYQTDNLWRKEQDGSLCSDSGYELISPTFEFNINKIFEHIEGSDILVEHINADTSSSCGGHINLSEKGLDGQQLFDKIKGYTPLFYALYYGRVNKNYCKGKCNDDLQNDNEKYQAIKIHSNRVEFRIISAVPSVETLKWRCKLIHMILRYHTSDIKTAFFHVQTKFKKLLAEQYKTDERMTVLTERFIKFSLEFENINLKDNN